MRLIPMLLLFVTACAGDTAAGPPQDTTAHLALVVSGLDDPVYLTAPAGDARLFVVEQQGRILVIRDGQPLPVPFLDIRDRVSSGGERGLFSVAFHPRYAVNGFFYVDYTDRNGDTRVERYTVSADPDVTDPTSATPILFVDQPFANHNGGLVVFGPDDMLYIGLGDGGSGGDPNGNGQNTNALLGKILRIDVDASAPYAIPADNPFASGQGGRGEVWAYGLRNPWRFAFDRETGRLYIADVGQNEWEEVNVSPALDGGLNHGWNIMEGDHCYASSECDRSGLVIPVLEYNHAEGCSITGGYVYRGQAVPFARGHYFYADYCRGWVRSFRVSDGGEIEDRREWAFGSIGQVLSFGEDAAGELYVLTTANGDGRVYRLEPGSG